MGTSIKKSLDAAVSKFETDYKESILNSSVDNETSDLLYALGVSIRDTFNSFAKLIAESENSN